MNVAELPGNADSSAMPNCITEVGSIIELQSLPETILKTRFNERYFERHINKIRGHPSSVGGFVENTAVVEDTAYLGPHALALDKSYIGDSAKICGWAVLSESSRATGQTFISGYVRLMGNSHADGLSRLYHNARLEGNGSVRDNAELHNNTIVCGCGIAAGNTVLTGNTVLEGNNSRVCRSTKPERIFQTDK